MDSLLQQRHDVGEVDVEPIVEGEGDRRLFAAEERHHSGYSGTQELQLIPRKCDFWVIADGEKISSSKRSGFACEIPRKD